MYVIKRSGARQDIHFDKVTKRIARLCQGLNATFCDPVVVAQKVVAGVYAGVSTAALDELAAETAAALVTTHPDYAVLAARIAVSNLHKNTLDSFSKTVERMAENRSAGNGGEPAPLVSEELVALVREHAQRLDSEMRYGRDFEYDFFGFKTLERSYLLRVDGRVAERPQHMLMRVSLGIHGADIEAAIMTYRMMSDRLFTHASPTLFNAGTPAPQMSSCFLVAMKEDSIEGIYNTLKECAIISKNAGGIGVSIHDVRATGSYIRGTNGVSNGIIPMLRVFNDTARYVDQGGGKRKGAFAMYLEPWHADILGFLDLRKNHGKEEARARDLFLGLWVCDLFMRRVEANGPWSLFCPNEAPGLSEVWGAEFEGLYERYEREGRARQTIRAQALWHAIIEAQIETGTPYMLYKDTCNAKSNHQHLGTIKCSNLCTEIVQFTSPTETAVCNLASVALPQCVVLRSGNNNSTSNTTSSGGLKPMMMVGSLGAETREFDFERLGQVVQTMVRNLNRIIDRNYYPVEAARASNMAHRPIGLGVQGLADVFILLGMPFDSAEAAQLNRDIFECMYFNAIKASVELAAVEGPYPSYAGSPVSRGVLQQDMAWPPESYKGEARSTLCLDWPGLRARILEHGVRNSLLLAPMPTASTSQILGNNECFEPYTSNIYVRRVLSGEFTVVNTHLMHDLVELGLWKRSLKDDILRANGSVQGLACIPERLKRIYKTVWEIKQRVLVDMAADRGHYIDQSQSFNVFFEHPDAAKLTALHFHAWRCGLKTGMYYLRTRPAADAIKFTVSATTTTTPTTPTIPVTTPDDESLVCSRENGELCAMCGA